MRGMYLILYGRADMAQCHFFWSVEWVGGKRLVGVWNKVERNKKEEPHTKCLPSGISEFITLF